MLTFSSSLLMQALPRHPGTRRELSHLGMLCITYNTIRSLVLPSSRTTKQLTRIAASWVSAALPRRTVPMRHIPSSRAVAGYAIELADLSLLRQSAQLRRSSRASSSAPGTHPYAPLRRTSSGCRAYSAVSSASAASDSSTEPIIVAASWLGAKKRPFSK